MSDKTHLQAIIKNLPKNPGVYRYYDKEGNILYIGKAKNLKNRVSSYFINKDHSYRIQLMVQKIQSIEYSIVQTERDALLLENSLIKELQPRYNILLKDDKTYPYIKIIQEAFPRIYFTRRYENDGAEYFGPYTSIHQVRSMLELIKKLYPIRSCSLPLNEKNIAAKKFKVCLEYHIGNCLAPCTGLQHRDNYDENIDHIRKILKGRLQELRSAMKQQMQDFANQLEFEKAEIVRIKLQSLKDYVINSTIVNPGIGNFHVFGYTEDEKRAYINYLFIYEGTIVKTKSITLQKSLDENQEELLQFAVIDLLGNYTEETDILLPFEINLKNSNLKTSIPKIGDKKRILELAQRNAVFQKQKGIEKNKINRSERILELMKTELKLNKQPEYIECFDNSNFQGTNAVAACVVFKNAVPAKKEYRHFNVKTVIGANDFDTMKEIIYRRYSKLLNEDRLLPDLIVIDGGKGQLNAAMESITQLGIENKVQVISIAKRLEEIYYPNDPYPLHISKKSESLKVIQHIRNEAHRFGITFHRNKRSKDTIKSELKEISGIGEKISFKLLSHFGSVKTISDTPIDILEKIIGKSKAQIVFNHFKK